MIEIKCTGSDSLPLDAINEFQGNLKKRTKKDIEKIITSIKKYGFSFPFFIWNGTGDNYCLDGHGRIQALAEMRRRGVDLPLFPVVYIEAEDEAEAKQKLLRLNSQYGSMSIDSVLEFAGDIKIEFEELQLPDGLLEFNLDGETQEGQDGEIVEDVEPVARYGDIWQLGAHRLMCGDSTKEEDVAKLMDGVKADMVFTDPPYNMIWGGGGGCFKETTKNMEKRVEKIIDFNAETISYIKDYGIGSFYIFTSKDLIPQYFEIFKEYNFNILLWCKTNPTPWVNYTFLPDVEYLLYFYKDNRIWNNGLKPTDKYKKYYISNKLEGRREDGDLHPTMKPLEMIRNKIEISSNKNGIVLDLFGGSGSTLIACENLNRKCYMMELDPYYCDVIINRWETRTGQKAVKIG